MMIEVLRTEAFSAWLKNLRDERARSRIVGRLKRLAEGNYGDVEPVGEGVSEMRIHYGPGYRLYFVKRGIFIAVVLCGGDKQTQAKDILRAKEIAAELGDF